MSDEELRRKFENLSLPFELWTHRAHVRIAYCFLSEYPFPEAVDRVKSGIKAYNAFNEVAEGPTSGYNETTTVAFLHIVHATMSAYGDAMPTVDSEAFCNTHPHLLHKQVLRLFYSPERRMHPDAKTTFVESDLTALPKAQLTASRSV